MHEVIFFLKLDLVHIMRLRKKWRMVTLTKFHINYLCAHIGESVKVVP